MVEHKKLLEENVACMLGGLHIWSSNATSKRGANSLYCNMLVLFCFYFLYLPRTTFQPIKSLNVKEKQKPSYPPSFKLKFSLASIAECTNIIDSIGITDLVTNCSCSELM